VLHDFFWVDAFARVQTHYLVKEVNKFAVVGPLIAAKVEALLQYSHAVVQTVTKQLVLLSHDFGIVTASDSKKTEVDL